MLEPVKPGGILVKGRIHIALLFAEIDADLSLVQPIDLPPGVRVTAHIVGRKVILPDIVVCEAEDRTQHTLCQLCIVQKEHRRGGVAQIHRSDTAVGVVFLGEKDHIAMLIGDQFMGGQNEAVAHGTEECVILAADGVSRIIQFTVKSLCLLHDGSLVRKCRTDGSQNIAVHAGPVGFAPFTEVVDGEQVIVGNDQPGLTLIVSQRKRGGQLAVGIIKTQHCVLIRAGKISVAPVNGHMVTAACKGRLHCFSHGRVGEGGAIISGRNKVAVTDDRLAGVRSDQISGCQKINLYLTGSPALYGKINVGAGAGYHGQVIGKQRRGEAHGQCELLVLKGVGCGKGGHINGSLWNHRVKFLVP